MPRQFSIGTRSAIPVVGAVLLLAAIGGIYMHGQAAKVLASDTRQHATTLAKSFAERSAEPLVTEDLWGLHDLVVDICDTDESVLYAFVVDGRGAVIAHSFGPGFPRELAAANSVPPGAKSHTEVLSTQEGKVLDIAVPILDRRAGVARIGISLRRTEAALGGLRRRFLFLAGGVLAVGVLVATAGARLIVKPLQALVQAATAVGQGDWSPDIPVRGTGEVAQLSQAFRTMLAGLRQSKATIEEHAQKLEAQALELRRELRHRKELEQQLIRSAKLAAIGTLAAGVAHELNQPLTVIRATAQDLQAENGINMEIATALSDIERQTLRMMRTIEHLRTFSRDHPWQVSSVQVNEIVQQALGMIGQQMRNRGIQLRLELCPDLPEITGNATQIEQVVLNLLVNARDAVEDQPEGGVHVATRPMQNAEDKHSSGVVIEVVDNGPGIPAELRERVFEPFFTTKEPARGTGLGLAVSHSIISQHGGEIEFVCNPGSGTTFRVWLPCRGSGLGPDGVSPR